MYTCRETKFNGHSTDDADPDKKQPEFLSTWQLNKINTGERVFNDYSSLVLTLHFFFHSQCQPPFIDDSSEWRRYIWSLSDRKRQRRPGPRRQCHRRKPLLFISDPKGANVLTSDILAVSDTYILNIQGFRCYNACEARAKKFCDRAHICARLRIIDLYIKFWLSLR